MSGVTQPSIARKLTGLTMWASGTALATACLAFGVYEHRTSRTELVQRLGTQAELIAANTRSALTFDDPAAANVTLDVLRGVPNIVGAIVLRPDGQLFASYHRAGEAALEASIGAGTRAVPRFERNQLSLTHPVLFQGRSLGTVTLVSDLRELEHRRRDYYKMSTIVIMASLVVSLLLSSSAQRSISKPIVALARLADHVSVDRDYSQRAPVAASAREVAALAHSFNHMLGQIQEQDRSLQQAHDDMEDRVRLRTAELDEANRELEAFSYSVSHDLRAPLRHVSGFAELLEQHAGRHLDEQGLKYVATIVTAARRMAQLIDDLLAFSRIGRASIHAHRVNLGSLVAEAQLEVVTQAGAVAAPQHITWSISDLPDVRGDAAMLRLAFVNLLSNAVKYSSRRTNPVIEVGVEREGAEEVEIFVRDNGVGFDMKYVDKLFGVFQRLHRADEFEGTGIGLANVKRMITRLGGRVRASGQVDAGAAFYVTLLKPEPI